MVMMFRCFVDVNFNLKKRNETLPNHTLSRTPHSPRIIYFNYLESKYYDLN